MQTTIQLRVGDKPGVLARVAGIVASTGSNIVALTVAPVSEGISQITVVADLEAHQRGWLVAKMDGLIDVHSAVEAAESLLCGRHAEEAVEPRQGFAFGDKAG
jgi:acetolactate synthase-1/3 small subunit